MEKANILKTSIKCFKCRPLRRNVKRTGPYKERQFFPCIYCPGEISDWWNISADWSDFYFNNFKVLRLPKPCSLGYSNSKKCTKCKKNISIYFLHIKKLMEKYHIYKEGREYIAIKKKQLKK